MTAKEWIATLIFGPLLALGLIVIAGMAMDTMAERATERDMCLKRATNGYEIRQCN